MEDYKPPKVIYLQIHSDPITWCEDQIEETDTKYIQAEKGE